MLTKHKVQELIEHMPDTFSIDDVVDGLILMQKVEKARQQIKDGESMSWDEVKKEMDLWFK